MLPVVPFHIKKSHSCLKRDSVRPFILLIIQTFSAKKQPVGLQLTLAGDTDFRWEVTALVFKFQFIVKSVALEVKGLLSQFLYLSPW